MEKKITGGLFFDIKAVYDNISPKIFFDKINDLRIPVEYKSFVKNFLEPRLTSLFESGIYKGTKLIQKGVLQGSVLSSMLFNIYVADILKFVLHNCKVIQFADDIAILISDSNIEVVKSSIQEVFKRINK